MKLAKPQLPRLLLAGTAAALIFAAIAVAVVIGAPPAGYPPAKATLEASLAQTRTAASSRPQPPAGATPVPGAVTPSPISRRPAGAGFIVTDFVPPFPAMSHVITSMWYEPAAAQNTIVYAGALRDNPGVSSAASQGVVIVQIERLDHTLVSSSTLATPARVGPVRITGAQGERLVLQSDNGSTFYFDVPSRQFVSSP